MNVINLPKNTGHLYNNVCIAANPLISLSRDEEPLRGYEKRYAIGMYLVQQGSCAMLSALMDMNHEKQEQFKKLIEKLLIDVDAIFKTTNMRFGNNPVDQIMF